MMLATEGNLHMLAGGLRVKARVQHPEVKPAKGPAGLTVDFPLSRR